MGWTVQWAAGGGWFDYGCSASVQDVVHDVGGCCGFCSGFVLWCRGVAVVGWIVDVRVHVGSARLGGHRGVAQLGGCSLRCLMCGSGSGRGLACCGRFGGLCRPGDGGEVHFHGGLGP